MVTRQQIIEAARDPVTGKEPENWHQRLSELRTDFGYDILSWRDNIGLKPQEYLLKEPNPTRPVNQREPISADVRRQVIERDKHCMWPGCTLKNGDIDPVSGGTVRLQVDHVDPHSLGPQGPGPSALSRYQALCPRHQVEKKNLRKSSGFNVLEVVRNASLADKKLAYEFLRQFFDPRLRS